MISADVNLESSSGFIKSRSFIPHGFIPVYSGIKTAIYGDVFLIHALTGQTNYIRNCNERIEEACL